MITDAEGGFWISAMEPGSWALRVDAQDERSAELVVGVLSGRRMTVAVAIAVVGG